MNYCFGVQSKNSVDTIIEFSLNNPDINTTFIPSRRQIDYSGGYVNNWNTQTFTEYVKSKNPNIKIQRDHGGCGQGYEMDDGYVSLSYDCEYFDSIHIDPWKQYSDFSQGCKWTIDMINFCYQKNPTIEYEIATEENIRFFTIEELEELIIYLKNNLSEKIFKQIKYLVIQSGTRLYEGKNIGKYDEDKLKKMLCLANKYDLIAKEHNGDWLSIDNIIKKNKLRLKLINIAPELAIIETNIILKYIMNDLESFEKVYNICFNSDLWKKWVGDNFDFINNKETIIKVSCHYHYMNDEIIKIKKIFNIDNEIKEKIYLHLIELYKEFYNCK